MTGKLPFKSVLVPESAGARLEALLSRAQAALSLPLTEDTVESTRLEQKAVGLRLMEELRVLAARTGAGLGLYKDAVVLCARVLENAGELIKAASLLSEAGLNTLAAHLAEKAGEIELLQEALQRIHAPEEARHAAALHFTAYENAMLRGHYTDALHSISQAVAARPDNPSYPELQQRLLARRPPPGRLLLQGASTTWCLALMPAWLGRGEDAALRLQGLGISRKHARIEMVEDIVRLVGNTGETLWQAAKDAAGRVAQIALGPLQLRITPRGTGVLVHVAEGNTQAMFLTNEGSVPLEEAGLVGAVLNLRWPRDGFPRVAVTGARFVVDGETAFPGGRDLMVGQEVEVGALRFRVMG